MSAIRKIFWWSLAVKLLVAGLLPLTGDEAYYWVWSRHMQLSYYDHPPFVAWLYWLGSPLDFLPGSVRWAGVLFGHVALALWLKLLDPFLNVEQLKMWLWLALLSPLMGGSGIVVTPDLPLMLFYALSLWLFFLWQKRPDWRMSLGFGVAIGLGLSSKYMMVLFPLSLLPVILMAKKIRQAFFKNIHWLILGGVAGFLPVLLWNVMHDWASFKFQAAHGLGRKWKPNWTVEYILAQIGLIFPPILYWALRAGKRMPVLFHFLAWTPLIFFAFTTSRGYVEANWPIAAYPAIIALAVSWYPLNGKSLKFTAGLWGTLLTALFLVLILRPAWSKPHKFREFYQFAAVEQAGKDLFPLYARSYQMASKMTFDLKRPIYKLRGMNRKDFFDFLEESEPKEQIFYVAVEKTDILPVTYAKHEVLDVIPVDETYEIRKLKAP